MEIMCGIWGSDMRYVVYFDNDNQRQEKCAGQTYYDFLDYAFSETDYFMLVYVNYYGKGLSKSAKITKQKLKEFEVKNRKNPCWPGTPNTYAKETTYRVTFYKNSPNAKQILKEVNSLSGWSYPKQPQDLAFFKGNTCWFYSVGHEKIGAIIHATEKDIAFVEKCGLSDRSKIKPEDGYYAVYDEDLI